MKCSSCGKEIPDESTCCTYCGHKETGINQKQCPVCEKFIPEGSPFCLHCGASLLTEKERKKIFADVKKSNIQKRREAKITQVMRKLYKFIAVVAVLVLMLLIGLFYFYPGSRY